VTEDSNLDHLMRVASLKQRLLELYAPEEVDAWFVTPQRYFQDRRPVDVLTTDAGYLEVSRVIDAVLDGAFI
jgi:uncharacterized protein (DUF2384 family)